MRKSLVRIWEEARVSGVSLRRAITNEIISLDNLTKEGRVISSVEGNGSKIDFLQQGSRGENAEEKAIGFDLLLDVYDRAKTALGGTPTDEQLYAEMRDMLRPSRSVRADFSAMRL